MKAKVIKTGEMVDVYHEPQHGQITNIYKESVLVNGRMWTEDELDFSVETSEAPEKISDFEMALTEMIDNAQKCVVEPWAIAAQWKDYLIELAKSEEPVKDRFAFKAIPRLLDMIEPTDKAKSYVTKLADAFDSEGYYTDAKIVRESLKIMNGEKVAMATMDEEPVSEELEKIVEEIAEPTILNAYGTKELARRLRNTICATPWKDAQCDVLPEIDREVIALLDNGKVVFAHRPYKGKYIGKKLTTGNIETFENKTYDKGCWNQPDIRWWLDIELPKEIEL